MKPYRKIRSGSVAPIFGCAILLLAIVTCDRRQRENPLDPQSAQFHDFRLTAAVVDGAIQLAWRPCHVGGVVAAYRLYRSESLSSRQDSLCTLGSSDSTYRDSTPMPDRTYIYSIAAIDASQRESSRFEAAPLYAPRAQAVISTDTLRFDAVQFGAPPRPQYLTIRNAGVGTLRWAISVSDSSWLDISPAAGAGNECTVAIRPKHTEMNPSLLSSTCLVYDPEGVNLPDTLEVFFDVNRLFGPPVYYQTSASDLLAADIDGDLDYDIVLVGSGGITALINGGDGAFAEVGLDTLSCSSAVGADLNGDGLSDLVVTTSTKLAVLTNYRNLEFRESWRADIGSSTPPIVADIEGDSNAEIVVGIGDKVHIWSRIDDSTYSSWPPFTMSTASGHAIQLLCGDIDGDEDGDVIVLDGTRFGVFQNLGAGKFTGAGQYSIGNCCRRMTSGDFDLDGDLDLAAAAECNNYVAVFRNTGGGDFQGPETYSTGLEVWDVIGADFYGYHRVDLVTANFYTYSNAGSITVLRNTGGVFDARQDFDIGAWGLRVITADFDGDGCSDVAAGAGNTEITVLTVRFNQRE